MEPRPTGVGKSKRMFSVAFVVAVALVTACSPDSGGQSTAKPPVEVPDPGRTVAELWGAPTAEEVNVAYGAGAQHRGDVFLPRAGGNKGTILAVHGGGFNVIPAPGEMSGQELMRTRTGLIMSQIDRGFGVFNITYRGADQGDLFPSAITDVDDAVKWLREHGPEHGLNTDTIITVGLSAGAIIVALHGTTANGGAGGPIQVSEPVDGWVAAAGAYDGSPLGVNFDPILYWLGGDESQRQWTGLMKYLDPVDPPGYLIHGDDDPLVNVSQLDDLIAAATVAKVGARLHYDRVDNGNIDPPSWAVNCRGHLPFCGANADSFETWLDKVVARKL